MRRGLLLAVMAVAVAVWCARYGVVPTLPALEAPRLAKLVGVLRALGALAVVLVAAVGASRPFAAVLRIDDPLGAAVVRVAAGLATLGTALGTLGVAGWFTPRAVLGTLAAAAVAGLPATVRALRGASLDRPSKALLGVVALLFAMPALHAFVPRYGWDALTYHLALPEHFLRAGRIGTDRASIYTSFPLLAESLYAACLALHGPALAKLLHAACGALTLLLVGSVARPVAPRAWPFAIAAVAADPTFWWETTVVYNDLALTLFVVALFEAVTAVRRTGSTASLLRVALFSAACAGTRVPGLLFPAAFAASLVADRRVDAAMRLRATVAVVVGALVGLAPWLARNAAGFGDPFARGAFHPRFLAQMVAFNRDLGMGHGALAFVLAPVNVVLRAPPGYYTGGFGYVVGPLHLAGAAALAMVPSAARLRGVGPAALLCLAGWFVTVQEARYLLPIFPVLGVALAVALESVWSRRTAVVAGVVASAALLGVATRCSGDFSHVVPVALGSLDPASIALRDHPEQAGAMLRRMLPPGARLLPLFESRSWHLRGVDHVFFHVNEGSPVWAELHDARVDSRLCAWLRGRGVTHVLINQALYQRSPPRAVPGYADEDIVADMRAVGRLLARAGDVVLTVGSTTVWSIDAARCARGVDTAASNPAHPVVAP